MEHWQEVIQHAYQKEIEIQLGKPRELTEEEKAQKEQIKKAFLNKRNELLEEHDRIVGLDAYISVVANLHSPVNRDAQFIMECDGCDYGGYEGEPPEWPCRTWNLIQDMI